jgi:hypothetical protein
MNCLAPAAQFEPLISRNSGYERLTFALKLFCGRGRRFTVSDVSKGAGVPERAIECAMYQPHQAEFRPIRFEYLLSLNKFLGAAFVSAYLEVAGLGAFELMGEQPLPSVLNADSAKPAETPREKVERLQRELFNAIEDMTA